MGRVKVQYNKQSDAAGYVQRSQRSLESKWSTINHDVSKFAGCFAHVVAMDESGTTHDDQVDKASGNIRDKDEQTLWLYVCLARVARRTQMGCCV